mgnify:FL=1|jgi:uncharacterized protein YqgV (UPF0045/DUF77 family)
MSNQTQNHASNAVNAISEYYNQVGLANYYHSLATDVKLDDNEELMRLAEKHLKLAQMAYDYILLNFKADIEQASRTVKEHVEKAEEVTND